MLLSSEITKNNILLLWFLPKANEMDVTDTRAMQGNSLAHKSTSTSRKLSGHYHSHHFPASLPMNMWNLVVDLVVGRAEQHQRIRIAIRQGRSAVRRLFEQVACARVRRHTRRVERNTGELRLSSQRRRRGRSGWPCRRAPRAPGMIRRRDAGGILSGDMGERMGCFLSVSCAFIILY